MKHIDLVKQVYDNRETIDRAYRGESIQKVSDELVETTFFLKIHDRYVLNKNYLNFVDSVLQRIDYSVIFGDYEKEYKELVKNKKRYLENPDEYYKKNIINLIENLYFKFYNRDREIQILLQRLENDTSLDIDILIENANDILEKIDELINANIKIGDFFRKDLRGLDIAIDKLLQNIGINILSYIENIELYIKQLIFFIIQTKKRRIQNKKILQFSNMILEENTTQLDDYLIRYHQHRYHVISKSQKNRVSVYADDEDVLKLRKDLKNLLLKIEPKKYPKESLLKPQAKEKLEIINIQQIIQDLDDKKSNDIFIFIKAHKELQKFIGDALVREAFKIYLQVIADKKVVFESLFNDFGIKVAKWL